jgi:ComB9 competence protein
MKKVLISLGFAAVIAPTLVSAQTVPQQGSAAQAPMPTKPLGLTQSVWNDKLRNRGESRLNPGYIRYVYNPANVFPIRTRESMITTIKLPEDVELQQAFSGDDQGFQVAIPTPNSIAVKALFPGVDTNLVAYTKDGKIFTFYVRSEGYNSKNTSDFLVDVVMPGEGVLEGSMITSEDQMMQDKKNPAQAAERIKDPYSSLIPDRREKYREYAEWSDFHPGTVVEDLGVYVPKKASGGTIPYRVFRDDRFTYVDYGPNATQMTEWPTPLIVVQGVEGPVGFRTAGPGGRMIVMEALGSFVLRNGQRIIIIKPRSDVSAKQKDLIEFSVASTAPMRVPTDLPPGRAGKLISDPKTVVPENKPATMHGEAPSAVVPLPQARKMEIKNNPVKAVKPGTAIVEEIAAPAPASPVRTVVTTGSATAAAGIAMGASPVAAGSPVITTNTIKPSSENSMMARYQVVIGKGSVEDLQDKWKSYKVQYYTELSGREMVTEIQPDGSYAMVVTPFASIVEAMKICNTLGSDGSACTVKPFKNVR